jgi:hypothetical protein
VEFAETKRTLSDGSLTDFIGADGLMRLLTMLHTERAEKEDVLEMIKRLHIPGYEHARRGFGSAISEDVFEPNTPSGYYDQGDIAATLEFMQKEEEGQPG